MSSDADIYGPFEEKAVNDGTSEQSKKTVEEEFDLDEADIFVDEDSPLFNHVQKSGEALIGMEQIIDDQTNYNIKCLLCRVILKDRYAIVQHLRDVQHQALYLERFHSVVYNCLLARQETPAKFCDLITRYAVELVTESGAQKCRTYRKGYSKELKKGSKSIHAVASASKKWKSPSKEGESRRTKSRSRSRSPHRFRSSSRNHDAHRHYRHRRESDGDDSNSQHSRDKGRSFDNDNKQEEEDIYGELSADAEISGVLLLSQMGEFQNGEKAFVHDEVEAIKHPLVGLGFVAEYADPWGAYQPGYLCALCEARYSPSQIVQHVRTDKHRLKFMERRYKTYHATVTLKTLPEDTRKDLIKRYCTEIEKAEGRGVIKRKLIIKETDRFIFRQHKPLTVPITTVRKRYSDVASVSEERKVEIVDRYSVPLPPKLPTAVGRAPVPQRPNFIYSEKTEKAKKMAEVEKLLPPFVERNLEIGWYSIRQFTLNYYQRLVPPMTPYISLRCQHATHEIYGTWSPYVMRRIQDQFNFSLDHLTWLKKLLLDWRIPLSKPLEVHELRPLADDVEEAVLNALVGQVLQPTNFLDRIHNRIFFEYEDTPTSVVTKKRAMETIVYDQYDETRETEKREIVPEEPPQKFIRVRRPSENSIGSNSNAVTSDIQATSHPQSLLLTPTPTEDDQKSTTSSKRTGINEKASAERAMLQLIDQILKGAKESKLDNPILNLLLTFDNARSILFALATKQPTVLQQLVGVMKNPGLVVPPETLAQLQKKLTEMANACNEQSMI